MTPGLWMSGPRERTGPGASSAAFWASSRARSTPQQKPALSEIFTCSVVIMDAAAWVESFSKASFRRSVTRLGPAPTVEGRRRAAPAEVRR